MTPWREHMHQLVMDLHDASHKEADDSDAVEMFQRMVDVLEWFTNSVAFRQGTLFPFDEQSLRYKLEDRVLSHLK